MQGTADADYCKYGQGLWQPDYGEQGILHHHVPTEEEYRQISESFRRKLEEAEHE